MFSAHALNADQCPRPQLLALRLGKNGCTITRTMAGVAFDNWLRRAKQLDAGVQEMVHNWLCGACEEHRRVAAIRAGANKRRMARFVQVAVMHEPQVVETREMARPPLPAAPRDIPAPCGLLLEGGGATPPVAPPPYVTAALELGSRLGTYLRIASPSPEPAEGYMTVPRGWGSSGDSEDTTSDSEDTKTRLVRQETRQWHLLQSTRKWRKLVRRRRLVTKVNPTEMLATSTSKRLRPAAATAGGP